MKKHFLVATITAVLLATFPMSASATSFGACGEGIPVVHGSAIVMAADVGDVQWYSLKVVEPVFSPSFGLQYAPGDYSLVLTIFDDSACSTPLCVMDLTTPTVSVSGDCEFSALQEYSVRVAYLRGAGTAVYFATL